MACLSVGPSGYHAIVPVTAVSTVWSPCRGATDIQRQLAARGAFDMPTTAMHLLQPANGTLLPAGEDVVVQFDVPMPGASALLVCPPSQQSCE